MRFLTRLRLLLILALALLAASVPAQVELFRHVGPARPLRMSLHDPALIAPADFNGDGVRDILVRNGAVHWDVHSGIDGLPFATLGDTSIPNNLYFSWINFRPDSPGDTNGDGVPDLACWDGAGIVLRSGSTNQILWTHPLPQIVEVFQNWITTAQVTRIGDADGDGIGDLAVSFLHWFNLAAGLPISNPPSAGFLVQVLSGATGLVISDLPLPPFVPESTTVRAVGDLDGDGLAEFALERGALSPPRVAIHRGVDGVEIASVPVSSAFFDPDFATGDDIDGDGIIDLVVAHPGLPPTSGGTLELVSGATQATFATLSGAPGEALGRHMTLGDFDGDGRAEIGWLSGWDLDPTGTEFGYTDAAVLDPDTGQTMVRATEFLPDVDAAILEDLDGDGRAEFITLDADFVAGTTTLVAIETPAGVLDAAAGNTTSAGGVSDHFRISGSAGDIRRRVEVAVGAPFSFDILAPGGVTGAFDYALFGFLGETRPDDRSPVGGTIGTMAFPPAPLLPTAVPALFTAITSLNGLPGTFLVTSPGPISLNLVAGLPVALDLGLQAVIIEGPNDLRRTNAIFLRVN